MIEVIGVRFKSAGKIYYFDPGQTAYQKGEFVIVETVRGKEMGEVMLKNRQVPDEHAKTPLRPVLRRATAEDFKRAEGIREKERRAFSVCVDKIRQHKLDMHLVDVEYTFDEQ